MAPQFDTWKFWLSSVAIFTGVLIVGLIPGCADDKPQQQPYHVSASLH